MTDYNYDVFRIDRELPYFDAFRDTMKAGETAPDFVLEDLEGGATVALSALWSDGLALIEFGSLT
jgi:hypothetical protein